MKFPTAHRTVTLRVGNSGKKQTLQVHRDRAVGWVTMSGRTIFTRDFSTIRQAKQFMADPERELRSIL